MSLKLITAPASQPVTLAEAKAHLNVDHTDHDTIIGVYIAAATALVDGPGGFLGRALIDQTWELTLDLFPTNEIKIPLPPLIEVVSVAYDDANGDEQVLATSDYVVDDVSEPGWVVPAAAWPSSTFDAINAVRVRFRAGYLDTSVSPAEANVPNNIRAAILLTVGHYYANREEVVIGQTATQLPWAAQSLLRRSRIDLSMA